MSNRYLDQHQPRSHHIQHHHRVLSAPDVPFSWEMSPGVSKHHEQSIRRHGREQLREYLSSDHHRGSSRIYSDGQDLLPQYLVHENARRAIQKPPLRPPPCLITSSPRVSSSHSEQLVTRGTPKTASKFGGRNKSGAADADPFLTAYMKCTTPQKAAAKKKSSGFSFSCKSSVSSGIRDEALVRIPRPS